MSIDGTITVEGSAVQDAQVQAYDRMRQVQDGSARTDSSGSYSISLSNNAGPYLIGVDYYDKSSDTYFGDEKTIMRNFADGLETGEYQRWWTINDGDFNIKTNHSYNGSYSAGIEDSGADKDVAEIAFNDWSGGTTNVRQVEFIWYELSSQHGGGLRVINSNGDEEVGLATDNPQWDTHSLNGWNEVYGGDDYQHWTLFRLENFDWSAGTVDYYMEDLSTGSTASGSLGLRHTVDMEKLYITNHAGDAWASNDEFYMWFDNITVLYMVWYSPYSYKREIQNVSLTNGLIVPLIDEDPDGDGSNSTYYAQDGYIYYNDDGDFVFGTDSGQKYGFSTFVDGVKNQITTGSAPNGLVAYYPLDNNNAWDPVGGNNGTNNGATTGVTGQVKNAYRFDYINNEYVEVPDDPSLDGMNELTISAWVNVDALRASHQRIVAIWGGSTNVYDLFIWDESSGGGCSFELNTTNNSKYLNKSGTTISTGSWHHIVAVYDGSEMRIYKDASLIDSASITGNVVSGSDPLTIGRDGGNYFDGLIDDIRIYDRALSSTEIQQIYNHTKPTTGNDPTLGSEQTI